MVLFTLGVSYQESCLNVLGYLLAFKAPLDFDLLSSLQCWNNFDFIAIFKNEVL
jgi:hypothetical protein